MGDGISYLVNGQIMWCFAGEVVSWHFLCILVQCFKRLALNSEDSGRLFSITELVS